LWRHWKIEFGWKRAQTSNVIYDRRGGGRFATSFCSPDGFKIDLAHFLVSIKRSGTGQSRIFFLCAYTSSLRFLFLCYGVLGGIRQTGLDSRLSAPAVAMAINRLRGNIENTLAQRLQQSAASMRRCSLHTHAIVWSGRNCLAPQLAAVRLDSDTRC